jgi:hypothetical protein
VAGLRRVLTEPRLLAVAATDPLASRESLRLADLAGRVLPYGRPADREDTAPEIRSPPCDLAQIFSLVELGSAVWFPPMSIVQGHLRPGLAYRTVADLTPLRLTLAWPRESRSAAVAAFVRAARLVADTPGHVVHAKPRALGTVR